MLSDNQARPSLRIVSGDISEVSDEPELAPEVEALDLVTEAITQACGDKALLLIERQPWGHTRPIPLVVIVPSCVYLIDPLLFPKSKIKANSDGLDLVVDGVLKPRFARKMSDNCDALVAALETGPVPEANMTALYCLVKHRFVFSPLSVDGVDVVTLRGLIRLLKRKGDLDESAMERVHLDLARRLDRAHPTQKSGS